VPTERGMNTGGGKSLRPVRTELVKKSEGWRVPATQPLNWTPSAERTLLLGGETGH